MTDIDPGQRGQWYRNWQASLALARLVAFFSRAGRRPDDALALSDGKSVVPQIRKLFKEGRCDDALVALSKAKPRTPHERRKLVNLHVQILHRLSQYAKVITLAQEIKRQFPDDTLLTQLLTASELEAAAALFHRGEYDLERLWTIIVKSLTDQGSSFLVKYFRQVDQIIAKANLGGRLAAYVDDLPLPAPITKLLLGTLKVAQGAQLAGAELCRKALDSGLPTDLEKIAAVEIAAATFHKLSVGEIKAGPALVVVEPGANLDIVRLALDYANEVYVCTQADVLPQSFQEGLDDEARIIPLKYRSVDIPEISELRDGFTNVFVRHAAERIPALIKFSRRGINYVKALTENLGPKVHQSVSYAFNLMNALETTGARRVFCILNNNVILPPIVRQLGDAQYGVEVWVACGASKLKLREKFGVAIASCDPLQVLVDDVAEAKGVRTDLEPRKVEIGNPFVELFPLPAPQPGRRRCVICITWNQIGNPLRAMLETLLPEWEPILVVMDRPADEWISTRLHDAIGDLIPSMAVYVLHWRHAYKAYFTADDAAIAVSRIFESPDLAEFKLRNIPLSSFSYRACFTFLHEAIHAVRLVKLFDRTLRAWEPAFVLSFYNGYSFENQMIILSAGHCGLPTFGVQNLLHGRDDRIVYPPVDRYLCFNNSEGRALAEVTGFPAHRISVIGSVAYDAILKRARSYDRGLERNALGILPHEKLIVVATQPVALAHNTMLVDLTLEALRDIPDVKVIIKLHPYEPESRVTVFRKQAEQHGLTERALVTTHHDIYRLLVAADLVVNMTSNVGIEAALLDRNVIAVEIDLVTHFSLGEIGLVEAAHTREEAHRQIRSLLSDPQARAVAAAKRKAFFAANPELTDGRSLDRLLEKVQFLAH